MKIGSALFGLACVLAFGLGCFVYDLRGFRSAVSDVLSLRVEYHTRHSPNTWQARGDDCGCTHPADCDCLPRECRCQHCLAASRQGSEVRRQESGVNEATARAPLPPTPAVREIIEHADGSVTVTIPEEKAPKTK